MNFAKFCRLLSDSSADSLEIRMAGAGCLASHFHVTEVGRVAKDFIDCGGQRRSETTCVLQTLVAGDTDHCLTPAKLSGILAKTEVLELEEGLPVDIEIQGKSIETHRVVSLETAADRLVIHVQPKRTACLAPDKCRLEVLSIASSSCCKSPSTRS